MEFATFVEFLFTPPLSQSPPPPPPPPPTPPLHDYCDARRVAAGVDGTRRKVPGDEEADAGDVIVLENRGGR